VVYHKKKVGNHWFVYIEKSIIENHSRVDEGVTVGRCKINRFYLAGDLVLLASSEQGLQHALAWFSAACHQAGMKIRTMKPEDCVSPENQASARCK